MKVRLWLIFECSSYIFDRDRNSQTKVRPKSKMMAVQFSCGFFSFTSYLCQYCDGEVERVVFFL